MQFKLSDKQLGKLYEWVKILPKLPDSAIGGAFTYKFTQTSLGVITVVEYFDGSKLDLTDFDEW